jgi:NAD(P)-dependent dehydrogenase (short-subunit alcohol dehydrogenase family)
MPAAKSFAGDRLPKITCRRPTARSSLENRKMPKHNSEKSQPVVLITGANRGIGLETARQLARRNFHVVVAARDEAKGRAAAESIQSAGGTATFLALDVNNSASIRAAAKNFATISGRLDVLINNAAIYPDEGVSVLNIGRTQMEQTFETNVFGPLEVTQAFLPYLRKSTAARVINFSSGYGQLDGLSADVPSYCLSKLTINGLTIMLAAALAADNIAVNSMCPGWVRTDMGGPNATRSIEEGADTAVWLAADAPQELTGKFFRDREEIPW